MAGLIIALDFDNARDALGIAQEMSGLPCWFKVGLELFISAGPEIVSKLKGQNHRVFLDLKLYDIPNTVIKAALAAAKLGADMISIHCQGGKAMCAGAAQALAAAFARPPLLIGVTALTSFRDKEMPGINLAVSEYGCQLAALARAWNLNGVVCSPMEAREIKRATGLLCVCPGIRPEGAAIDDQGRTDTPAAAIRARADYLVVGRPITKSGDPRKAACAIIAEMTQTEAATRE